MKQIITLFILLFVGISSSFAVTSTVATADEAATSLTIDSQKGTFFTKAKTWVQKTVAKAMDMDDNEVLLILLAIFISPVAVYLYEGSTWTNRVTLNLILYIVGFGILGMAHALYLILGKK